MDISISHEPELVTVKLAGVINEDNDLAEHLDLIDGSWVAINLSDVERINSCGLRDWVNWINALEAKGSKMLFLECSLSIVAQINVVNNFTGTGRIKSLYLPYYCEACNEAHPRLYEAEDLAPEQLPPASRCIGCEQIMDFDDMPDTYFAFLSNPDQVLLSGALPRAQSLALSTEVFRASAPVFALGSRHQSNIEELLPSTTKRETEVVETALAPEPEPERRVKLSYVWPGFLVVAAGICAYFMA